MRDISGIELNVVVDELRGRLHGCRFKNFYELGDGAFLIALSKDGKETDIYVRLNKTFNSTGFKEQSTAITTFAKSVREKLKGARVAGIEQHGFDRIATLEFERGGEKMRLIVELFGKGNMLIVGSNGITELAYRNVSFRDRETRRNMLYKFPKSESLNPDEINASSIAKVVDGLKESDGKLISELYKRIGVGPAYIEDIIARAGLDPNSPAKDIKGSSLAKELLSFFSKARSPEPRIYVNKQTHEYVDFAILPLLKYAGMEEVRFEGAPQLNAALDKLYLGDRSTGIDEAKARKIGELEASIAKLRKQIEETGGKDAEYSAIGRRIFERMGEINALIERARKAKPKSAKDLGEAEGGIRVRSVDPKSKMIKIELSD